MDGDPSSLKCGDLAILEPCVQEYDLIRGIVLEVHKNGAFLGPVNDQNVRLLERSVWCDNDQWVVTEVNGDPVFEV